MHMLLLSSAEHRSLCQCCPDASLSFILDLHASDVGLGAVMSQEVEGAGHVFAYFSRALSGPERNYSVTRHKLLAVVAALKHFLLYLYEQTFMLRTNHKFVGVAIQLQSTRRAASMLV